MKGIAFKLLGVLSFCLIYVFYYGGGDTANYFQGTKAIAELLLFDFNAGFSILLDSKNVESSWLNFKITNILPPYYMWKDPNTFFVSKLSVPFYFLGFKRFLFTSFLTACFSFIGTWKLFRLFNKLYPGNSKAFAYLILYLPTLIFWGGGIMKDSYVLGATCWITYNFYMIFIQRNKLFWNILFLLFNIFIILNTKAYVVISLLPGMLFWINNAYIKNINNQALKILILPVLVLIIFSLGFFVFNNISSFMGVYGDVDTAIKQAQVIQGDLLRVDQYGDNNYNIGELDGSFGGLISVAPLAVFTALFRPFIWEVGSPTMILSVIENSILIIFTFIILIRLSPINILKILLREPFLLYCFVFSLLFAFGVGIAGTNFGALVRYKTPVMPFFFSMVYILNIKASKSS